MEVDEASVKVNIEATSEDAVNGIKKVTKALKEAKAASDQKFNNPMYNLFGKNVDTARLVSELAKYDRAISSTEKQIKSLQKAKDAMDAMMQKSKETGTQIPDMEKFTAKYNDTKAKIRELSDALNRLKEVRAEIASAFRNPIQPEISDVKSKVVQPLKDAGAAAKEASERFRELDSVTNQRRSTAGNLSEWASEMTKSVESPDPGFIGNMREIFGTSELKDVADSIRNSAQEARDAVSDATQSMSDSFSSATPSVYSFGNIVAYTFAMLSSAIKDFARALADVVHIIRTVVSMLAKAFSTIVGVVRNGISRVGKAIESIRERARAATAPVAKLVSSFGRIAFYRMVRSAIKAVTEAFKKGLEYAYAFSNGIAGEGHRFAQAMDSMKSAGTQMKAQLGSAFIGLLTAIAPIVNAIIALVTKLADALSQLFAAFTGGKYLKAKAVSDSFADTMKKGGAAAKEWKNQLLGFDEINRLNEPSGGGGGGGLDVDPMSMFEATDISTAIKTFVADLKNAVRSGDWEAVGKMLAEKITSIFPSAEKWEEWGAKLGYFLNGAVQSLYHFIDSIDFASIGRKIAAFLNGALANIDFTYWGRILVQKVTLAIDFLSGFLGDLDWKKVGESIFDFLSGAINEASEWLSDKDWDQVGQAIFDKFSDLIKGIKFSELAESFFSLLGKAFGAAVKLLDGFFSDTVQAIKDYFREKTEEMGGDTWEGFKKGVSDAWSGVKNWCKEHIVDPFVNGVKDLLGIHSPSTVFADIGKNIIDGLKSGISSAWSGFTTWIGEIFGGLISWCQKAHMWLQDVLDGIGLVKSNGGGSWWQTEDGYSGRSGKFASGGHPETGQLFIAREAGPEMVGTMNGQNTVATNADIVAGIRQGVFEAVSAAMNNSNGGEAVVKVYLDGREIRSSQQRVARAMGV